MLGVTDLGSLVEVKRVVREQVFRGLGVVFFSVLIYGEVLFIFYIGSALWFIYITYLLGICSLRFVIVEASIWYFPRICPRY